MWWVFRQKPRKPWNYTWFNAANASRSKISAAGSPTNASKKTLHGSARRQMRHGLRAGQASLPLLCNGRWARPCWNYLRVATPWPARPLTCRSSSRTDASTFHQTHPGAGQLPRSTKTGKRAVRTRRISVKETRKKIHVPLVRVPAVNIAANTWKCLPKRMFTNVLTKNSLEIWQFKVILCPNIGCNLHWPHLITSSLLSDMFFIKLRLGLFDAMARVTANAIATSGPHTNGRITTKNVQINFWMGPYARWMLKRYHISYETAAERSITRLS